MRTLRKNRWFNVRKKSVAQAATPSPLHLFKLVGVLLCLGLWAGNLPVALANSFQKPDLPGRREGAGSRGGCIIGGEDNTRPLIPIIPESQLGTTLDGHPTFFWHQPKVNAETAKFTLYSNYRGTVLYSTVLAIEDAPGIASFQLPKHNLGNLPDTGLEIGKTYYWTLEITCKGTGSGSSATDGERLQIQGFVQRVTPPQGLQAKLEQTALKDRYRLYASAGLWHELLTSLVLLKISYPDDATIQQDWNSVMRGVRLEQLIDAKVGTCCHIVSAPTSLQSEAPSLRMTW